MLRQRYQRPLVALLGLVGLVLLIACVNLANLLLARAAARRHELSVRLALGAPRWRIGRQWLIESVILATIGAALALLFALWGSRALVAQIPAADFPVAARLAFDWRVLSFATAATFVTTLIFGVWPAVRASRTRPDAALSPSPTRRQTGRHTGEWSHAHGGRARVAVWHGASSSLVIAQVALSLVIVVAAGLLVRTFAQLANVPLGFSSDSLLLVHVNTSRLPVASTDRHVLSQRLADAVAAVPGVAHAAASTWTPPRRGIGLIGHDTGGALEAEPRGGFNVVTPRWFETYGIGIRAGRDFDSRDSALGPPVMAVSDTYVRRFLPDRDPIGATVGERTIVAVVGDALHGSPRDVMSPMTYVPLAQSQDLRVTGATTVSLSVRARSGAPDALAPGVGAALSAFDPNLTYRFGLLADEMSALLAEERLLARFSALLGLLALGLAALGLYGVTAYAVARRQSEIGIRMALGAQPPNVIHLMTGRSLMLVAVGIGVGAAGAAATVRSLEALLFGVGPWDLATFASAAVLLTATTTVAASLPAWRATRIDPVATLRSE